MMTQAELDKRFDHHPPDPAKAAVHATVRELVKDVALTLNVELPDGREKAEAFTHLEDVLMWANAAIARAPLPTVQ